MEVGNMIRRIVFLLILTFGLSLIYGCGERTTKEQLFALAEKYEKEENFLEAIKNYKKIVDKYPHSDRADQAQYKTALIYSNNLNDFHKSVESHKKLIEKYPDSKYAAQSLFMIGFIFANNLADTAKAKKYYHKFLEKYPDNELVASVQWELDHLGQDINEIDFLNQQANDKGEPSKKEQQAQ